MFEDLLNSIFEFQFSLDLFEKLLPCLCFRYALFSLEFHYLNFELEYSRVS